MGKFIDFFKNAFSEMKDSARAQHEVDKANFEATKAEAKANREEAKAKGNPATRKAAIQAERDRQIEDAKARKAEAEIRLENMKKL